MGCNVVFECIGVEQCCTGRTGTFYKDARIFGKIVLTGTVGTGQRSINELSTSVVKPM